MADKPEAALTAGAKRWLADVAGSRERLATFPIAVQQSLDAWQTERGEWFDDTVLEIVAEYAAWNTRATPQPDASALVEALRLASGRLKWVSTANPGAGCDNGRTLAASWADDAAAALTAWEAQHG